MKRYMLDIETLGNYGCSVLLQIAAISFDEKEVFNVKLNPDKQPKSITTEGTIAFWSDKEMPHGDDDLVKSLIALNEFFKNADEVWCHNFDHEILFAVCREYNVKIPYHYKKFRDIRTLVALSKVDLMKFDWNEKTHDALDDCKFQVKYCTEAMRLLNI